MRTFSYIKSLSARFHRTEDGSALTSFATVIPIILVMTAGIMELSSALFASSVMEGALREASRFGITGTVPDGVTREERMMEIMRQHTAGYVNIDGADIKVRVYPSFSELNQPEPFSDENGNGQRDSNEDYVDVNGNGQWDSDMGMAGMGGPGDIVLYEVDYEVPLLTGLIDDVVGNDKKFSMNASIVVRNEPYGAPSQN